MPNYRYGEMFDHFGEYDLFLVTTNSYIRKNGSLVMGRGAAKQLADCSDAESFFGKEIQKKCGNLGRYGVLIVPIDGLGFSLGIFQVKYHFKEKASLELIDYRSFMLEDIALRYKKVCINYPGIGFGGITKPWSLLYLATLVNRWPNNIDVWRFEEKV